eukprot:scaffold3069_cov215-Amphora_coffeaeformis.AAC.14
MSGDLRDLAFENQKVEQHPPMATPSSPRPCPSLFQQKSRDNEHVPLLFEEHNLVVCRTPKVGSLEIRSVHDAVQNNRSFTMMPNRGYRGKTAADLDTLDEFDWYMHDTPFLDNTTSPSTAVHRIMFVRHPVVRILSGFKEVSMYLLSSMNKHKKWKGSPQDFRLWVDSPSGLNASYHRTCDENSQNISLHSHRQHVGPPQHCRCGIFECGVEWTVYKLEEHTIQSVFHKHGIPDHFLPPPTTNGTNLLHARRGYRKADYLAPDILERLNRITLEERLFFGYPPLTIEDVY